MSEHTVDLGGPTPADSVRQAFDVGLAVEAVEPAESEPPDVHPLARAAAWPATIPRSR